MNFIWKVGGGGGTYLWDWVYFRNNLELDIIDSPRKPCDIFLIRTESQMSQMSQMNPN